MTVKTLKSAIILIIVMSLNLACSPSIRMDPAVNSSARYQDPAREFSAMDSTDPLEQQIREQALGELFYYLDQRYGPEKFQSFLIKVRQSGIAEAVYQTYHKSFYQLSYEMLKGIEQDGSTNEMISSDEGPFRFHYFPGSRAQKDMPLLKYMVSRYFQQIREDVLLPMDRWNTFETNLRFIRDEKIHIYLYDNNSQSGIKSIAETSISYGIFNREGQPRFELSVDMRFDYLGLLSSYTFVHEMSHAILGLSRGDFQALDIDLDTWKDLPVLSGKTGAAYYRALFNDQGFQKYLKSELQQNLGLLVWVDRADVWEEGMAEYLVGKYNLFQQSGMVPPVDRELAFYLSRGQALTPITKLLRSGYRPGGSMTFNPARIYKHYQEGHSWIKYLADVYGQERLMRYYFQACPPDDFKETFGDDIEAVNRSWIDSVQAQAGKKH